jgi:D-methionine transport system substrate-binding protein
VVDDVSESNSVGRKISDIVANIIAVKTGDETSEKITALIDALKTDAVKAYIEETYNGAVVAIF